MIQVKMLISSFKKKKITKRYFHMLEYSLMKLEVKNVKMKFWK